ncbi:Modification methylase Eco57IB [Eubacterium plexicaudatum ASF492]|uniref:site-specific DNA-methyltransferase (adenine-specific) n=1 Tax=Eubacterium plexicaudatum ASF492 TaxID=1235802 RepID=N2B4B5_9FIRM|nr:Modification methylase Eco57IB [Eubacterium plexicaudatum ASF492]
MILKEDSTKQKLRGAYYTPVRVAEKMVEFFQNDASIRTILEPSCGNGVFAEMVLKKQMLQHGCRMTAIEIEALEVRKAAEKLGACADIQLLAMDFFEYYQQQKDKVRFDLILGNPPYIRYQYLEERQRAEMSQILTEHGMKANKLINTWVGFLVACVHLLGETGKIAFVIPAEILQVAYAEELRLFLTKNLTAITLLTFEELVFPDIEQEIIIFIGEKGGRQRGMRIVELQSPQDLDTLQLPEDGFQNLNHVHEKWTKYFMNREENSLIAQIRTDSRFQKMSDTALINIGITTGNNKYFSVTQKAVREYELYDVVRPLIGRSSHAGSVYFYKEDWSVNAENGKAAYLIDFPDVPLEAYPKKHRSYIKKGEKNKEHAGYKCRIRERWYRVPSIWVPDAFFLRRNNLYPKFVLNCCEAVSTDTMHRIQFYEGVEPERIVLSYYNSISFAFTELCGRSYGGGVLEILPGELGNVVLPVLDAIPIETIRTTLHQVDEIVRQKAEIEKALDLVDTQILVKGLGLDADICITARNIWKKMQLRRLRRG